MAERNFTFKGDSSQNCEDFIQAVISYAFEKGQHHDDEWVAEFAATRLKGPALRWHTDLNDSVQGSWKALKKALLERWPSGPDSEAAGCATIPQPAAAAGILTPTAREPTLLRLREPRPWVDSEAEPLRPLLGHLRAFIEGSDVLSYVGWRFDNGKIQLVRDVREAATAKIDPLTRYQDIILVDASVYGTCWLAGCWEGKWPPVDDGGALMVGMVRSGRAENPGRPLSSSFWHIPHHVWSDMFLVNEDGIFDVALQMQDTDTTRGPVQLYQMVTEQHSPIGESTLFATLDFQATSEQTLSWAPESHLRKITLKFEPL